MTVIALGKSIALSRRVIPLAILVLGAAVPCWTRTAEARFTCSTNLDCAAKANQCDPGQTPCNDGICSPGSPGSDAIGCVLIPNDAKCDDGNFCNGPETCFDRHCHAGTPPDCGDSVACTLDVCDEEADTCRHERRDSSCSNGLFCDGKETCDATAGCLPGTAPQCGDGNRCTTDRCDELANACVHTPTDASCDDGNFCNGIETCNPDGGCNPGTPPNCDDDIACTTDTCDEANDRCSNSPKNSVCSNGLFCDGKEICDATEGCLPGTAPNCNDSIGCTKDACDEANDRCSHSPNNSFCSNGQFCDGTEICSPTQGCGPGVAPNCNDSIACTTDACDEANDRCSHSPNNSSCNNGLFCDGTEICSPTQGCGPGTAPNCNDSVACTTDACDEANDRCSHSPDNSSCNNGLFCDGTEICSPTQGCRPGNPANCSDGVDCTTDRCVEASDSCEHTPVNSNCNNGKFCDGVETCSPTLDCQDGVPPDCSDDVECTVDACVEATDSCSHVESDSRCTNGLFCDGNEICDSILGCHPGVAPVCADNNECTIDTCDEENNRCAFAVSDELCSNGLFCDGEEYCSPALGCRPGTAPVCVDAIDCTTDVCVEATDTCAHTPNHAVCGNLLFCDGTETCDPLLGCQPGTPPVCTDSLTCTNDSCSEFANKCLHTPNGALCRNGVVEPACGEECDPGMSLEICNNLVDDDGDSLIDCADPNCATVQIPTCSATCTFVPPCAPLLRDPAVITLGNSEERSAGGTGTFSFHARLIPSTPVDPMTEGFIVTLSNANGIIYSAELKPIDLQSRGNRVLFRAPVPDAGIVKLSIRRRVYEERVGYGFRVKAVGDFSRATLPRMTTQVYMGDDVGYVTAEWTEQSGRWVLHQKDYDWEQP